MTTSLAAGLVGGALLGHVLIVTAAVGAQGPPTIWDGVYTPAQAERGRETYERACSYCHRSDLTGGEDGAPSLKENFLLRWQNRPVEDLLRFLLNNMPAGNPGSLSEQEYLDVTSFIFKK